MAPVLSVVSSGPAASISALASQQDLVPGSASEAALSISDFYGRVRGALREALEALRQRGIVPPLGDDEVAALCGRFANWLVLAHHVAERGEIFRAVDALAHMQRHLLWMARLAEGRTHHWLTPSRCAEAELSRDAIELLRGAVPRGATGADVRKAIHAAWQYGKRLWEELAARHKLELPDGLFMQIDQAVAAPNPVL